jgi:Uma2 family endonuclease
MHTEEVLQSIFSDYEIERGKPMPSKHHAIIQDNLGFHIRLKYGDRFRTLPEISLDLPVRGRVPDLAIYPSMEYGEEEVKMTRVPLAVVEILSPTQSQSDLKEKRHEYFNAGVQSYWVIFPDLYSVYVYYSSKATDFEVFSKQENLVDKKLGIELALQDLFK